MITDLAIIPKTFAEAKAISIDLALSQVIPSAFRKKPEDILAVVMTGSELGFPPMVSLKLIKLINGQPSLAAEGIAAMVMNSRKCKYLRCIETTATIATYETQRDVDPPVKFSFTTQMAEVAGLIGKDNWRHYPDAMLRARAVAAICRMVYPDVTSGLPPATEEVQDYTDGSVVEVSETSAPQGSMAEHAASFAARVDLKGTPAATAAPTVDAFAEADFEAKPVPQVVAPAPAVAVPTAAVSPIEGWKAKILAAKASSDLVLILPELRKLPSDVATALRPIYAAQREKVKV